MTIHRFILEPYKGIKTRHTCPSCQKSRCFTRYIDREQSIKFLNYVGRCDHEQSCAYHFTPREYFNENPEVKEKVAYEPTNEKLL